MNKDDWIDQVAWEVTQVINKYGNADMSDREYILDVMPLLHTKLHKRVARACLLENKKAFDILTTMVKLEPELVPNFEVIDDDTDDD